jgi:hypothetical protein
MSKSCLAARVKTRSRYTAVAFPGRRPAAEIVAATLERLPTLLGRLLYLANCREANGRYVHHGLQLTHDADSVHHALLDAHRRCFEEWLSLALVEQFQDLSAYMTGLRIKRVLTGWRNCELWSAVAAPAGRPEERELFASEFRRLLDLLRS